MSVQFARFIGISDEEPFSELLFSVECSNIAVYTLKVTVGPNICLHLPFILCVSRFTTDMIAPSVLLVNFVSCVSMASLSHISHNLKVDGILQYGPQSGGKRFYH